MRNAHDILVMDRGQIVEQGDHDSLVAKGGIYAKMVARQTGGGLASNIDVRPASCCCAVMHASATRQEDEPYSSHRRAQVPC